MTRDSRTQKCHSELLEKGLNKGLISSPISPVQTLCDRTGYDWMNGTSESEDPGFEMPALHIRLGLDR